MNNEYLQDKNLEETLMGLYKTFQSQKDQDEILDFCPAFYFLLN